MYQKRFLFRVWPTEPPEWKTTIKRRFSGSGWPIRRSFSMHSMPLIVVTRWKIGPKIIRWWAVIRGVATCCHRFWWGRKRSGLKIFVRSRWRTRTHLLRVDNIGLESRPKAGKTCQKKLKIKRKSSIACTDTSRCTSQNVASWDPPRYQKSPAASSKKLSNKALLLW